MRIPTEQINGDNGHGWSKNIAVIKSCSYLNCFPAQTQNFSKFLKLLL